MQGRPTGWNPSPSFGQGPPQGWARPPTQGWAPPGQQGWGTPGPGGPFGQGYPPAQWQTPPPPKGRGAVIAIVVAVVTLVSLVSIGGASLFLSQLDPQPSATPVPPSITPSPVQPTTIDPTPSPVEPPPPPPPPASPDPDPGSSTWELPVREWTPIPPLNTSDELWTQLQGITLLGETPAVLTGCPAPQTVDTDEGYKELVLQQWHCVHLAWTPMFEKLGWSTVEPPVEFYPGTGSGSECGYLEAPAFYCSAGIGAVYFGAGHMEMVKQWDLSVNEMVNHEYGHHLQSLAGITEAKLQLEQTNEIERRAELQATCWSAAMTFNNQDVGFDESHWDSWQQRLETMTIDGIHGSRESILYWGTRGLYATTMQDCNTWAVEADEVS